MILRAARSRWQAPERGELTAQIAAARDGKRRTR
jgi:hypothetical protein